MLMYNIIYLFDLYKIDKKSSINNFVKNIGFSISDERNYTLLY